MKHITTIHVMILVLTVGLFANVQPTQAQQYRNQIIPGEITQAEESSLLFMREEEKLARDVYLALYEEWNLVEFSNIASSEQMHMDAIKNLLDAYGLDDPIQDIGIFANQELQTLYTNLVNQGIQSEQDALNVGALIEEVDIEDLEEALLQTTAVDIQRVYENLLAGSENHLRAFVNAYELFGETYTAQVLSQDEVDAILAGSNGNRGPKGNAGTNGRSQGRNNQANQSFQNYVDQNGDGICDNTGNAIGSNTNNHSKMNQRNNARGNRR